MCCLSTAWEDEKKFPTALACVCGMKHFSTGVGLVLNLQVGETLNWVTIMERMWWPAAGVILPPLCSVSLEQDYFNSQPSIWSSVKKHWQFPPYSKWRTCPPRSLVTPLEDLSSGSGLLTVFAQRDQMPYVCRDICDSPRRKENCI